MDDKIVVIICVTVLCLATLGVAMHATNPVPDNVIALMEKAMYGLFGLASGAGIGFALGKKSTDKKKDTP